MKVSKIQQKKSKGFTGVLSLSLLIMLSCNSKPKQAEPTETPLQVKSIELKSAAFQQGQSIPIDLTCTGQDSSPELSWSAPPLETHTLALVMDDPDAPGGTWQHWLVYNIPGNSRSLSGTQPAKERLENTALQGTNDFEKLGYNGPCPPPGNNHRYYIRLYALNKQLELKAGASRNDLDQAMQGHIIAQGELMGTFKR